jgi:hypothetical protein
VSLSTTCLSILAASLLITASASSQSGTAGMEVAPGLRVTPDAVVWVLESPTGKPAALHPIARNNATVTAKSSPHLDSPRTVTGMAIHGSRAAIRIHAGPAVLYVQYSKSEDEENHKPAPSAPLVFALIRLRPAQNARVVAWPDHTTAGGTPKLSESVVEATDTPSGDFTWLKITPAQPLTPGEYAVVQLMPAYNTLSTWIFDFGVD